MSINWLSNDLYGWCKESEINLFEAKEYLALNNSVQLAKFDPIEINKFPPLVAMNLVNLFPGFKIYQFNRTSKYRQFPVRIIYSKAYGKSFELKNDNQPLYEIMSYIRSAGIIYNEEEDEKRGIRIDEEYKKDRISIEDWIKGQAINYIRFFFDNVSGRHGRFNIIPADSPEKWLRNLTDRIDNGYKIEFGNNVDETKYHKEFEKELIDWLDTYNSQTNRQIDFKYDEKFKKKLGDVLKEKYGEKKIIPKDESTLKEKIYGDVLMVFKQSLFITKATLTIEPYTKFGGVRLSESNQIVIKIKPKFLNPDDKYEIDLEENPENKQLTQKEFIESFPYKLV